MKPIKQLRQLDSTALQDPETQRKLESQASAEAMNGRRYRSSPKLEKS